MAEIGTRDFKHTDNREEAIEKARQEARIDLQLAGSKGKIATIEHKYFIQAQDFIELWCLTLARNLYSKEDKEVCIKIGFPKNRARYLSALEVFALLGKQVHWKNKLGKKEEHVHLTIWPKAEEVGEALQLQREKELLYYQNNGFKQIRIFFPDLGETLEKCLQVSPKELFVAMQMAINTYLLLLCKIAPLRFALSNDKKIGLGEEICAFSQIVKPQRWSPHATKMVELALSTTPFTLLPSGSVRNTTSSTVKKSSTPSAKTMDPERLLFYMKFFGYQRPNPLNGILAEEYWQIWFRSKEDDKAVLVLDAPVKGNAIYTLVGPPEQLAQASTTMTKAQLQKSGLMPNPPIIHNPEGRGHFTWQEQVAQVLVNLVAEFKPL